MRLPIYELRWKQTFQTENDMTPREKLDFVNYLIFLRGKLQGLAIKLLLEGQPHDEVDEAEQRLAELIRRLRVDIMQQWQGDAKD